MEKENQIIRLNFVTYNLQKNYIEWSGTFLGNNSLRNYQYDSQSFVFFLYIKQFKLQVLANLSSTYLSSADLERQIWQSRQAYWKKSVDSLVEKCNLKLAKQ